MKKAMLSLIILVAGAAQAALEFQGSAPLVQPAHNLQNGAAPSFSMTFKNTGTTPETLSAVVVGTTQYKIATNRCINVAANRSCSVSVSPSRTIPVGNYSFTVAGVSVQQSIVKQDGLGQDIVTNVDENISFESAPGTTQFAANETSRMLYFSVKNIGNVAVSPTIEYTANPKIKVIINRCSSLKPALSCLFSAKLTAPAPGESYNQSFSAKVGSVVKDTATIPVAGPPFTITNLVISNDGKAITVTGSNFNQVNIVRLMSQDGSTMLDEMEIFSKTNTEMVLKPSANLVLNQGTFTLRLLN